MDNKQEFKNFLHGMLALVLLFVVVAASAGSINYGAESGKGLYIVMGALNLGWIYAIIRQLAKYLKKHINS